MPHAHRTGQAPARLVAAAFAVLLPLAVFGCGREADEPTAPNDQPPNLAAGPKDRDRLDSALAVHRRNTARLIAMRGTVGTAVGLLADGRPGIKIFLERAGAVAVGPRIEGIPVEVQVTGPIVAQPCTPTTCTNTDIWPLPVPIGISTSTAGVCTAGTIGARVLAGGTVYALSNNHVYAGSNSIPLGTNVLQAGRLDAVPQCSSTGLNVLGTLSAFQSIAFCGASCPNNTLDAAIAVSATSKLGRATPPAGYGTPKALPWPAVLGLPVKKYGRTTSLTTGVIAGIDATIRVDYPGVGTAQFIHQIVMGSCPTACSKGGDSGSLIVSNDASANPMGLLFAGNTANTMTFANRIGDVLARFGVSVDGIPAGATASGAGLAASRDCGLTNCVVAIQGVTASGNVITIRDNGGHTGTITLAGTTASGGLTATPNCGLSNCTPAITSISASGSNVITVRDNMGHTGSIVLSGALASGGLGATLNCGLTNCVPAILSVSGSGSNGFTITDNGSHIGTLKFQ
jgi:hypothetical protein